MPPDPPSGCALRALLHFALLRFAKYSNQVHTAKNLLQTLDPLLNSAEASRQCCLCSLSSTPLPEVQVHGKNI